MTKPSIFSKINQSIDNLVTSSLMKESEAIESNSNPLANHPAIAAQIQLLEAYLDRLVSTLQQGQLPVNLKKVTQVFDSLVTQERLPIDIPACKFIELYNDLPTILTGYAIEATLSDESYRQTNTPLITFHRLHRGNYWIFPTDRIGKPGAAWLVPNPLKAIKISSKSIEFSFDIKSSSQNNSNIIILEKPALVQILSHPDRVTWKLIERGEIIAGDHLSSSPITTKSSIDSSEIAKQIEQIVQAKLRASDRDILQQCRELIERNLKDIGHQPSLTAQDYFDRARQKEQQNDVSGALADYNAALDRDPSYANAYFNRGMLQKNSPLLKDITGAIFSFRSAAQLYKQQGHLEIYKSLLEILKEMGANE